MSLKSVIADMDQLGDNPMLMPTDTFGLRVVAIEVPVAVSG
jgi:hypothetical protein